MKGKKEEGGGREPLWCAGRVVVGRLLPTAPPAYSEVAAASSAAEPSLDFLHLIYQTRILVLLS